MAFIESLAELLRRLMDYRAVQQGDRDLHMHVMFNLLVSLLKMRWVKLSHCYQVPRWHILNKYRTRALYALHVVSLRQCTIVGCIALSYYDIVAPTH